ncbi:MAG: F0F1 ATP synthase subunit I [Gammaproteobacteria bacterium]|nr:F0F1 ATP synthase subunit I [Gammaproteobacteria bacterium]
MEKQADNTNNKLAAYKVLLVIAIITAAIAITLMLSIDRIAAYSAALGGIACILPNLLFARFAFRYSAAESAGLVMKWFYIGEAIKIIVTVLIFALSLIWLKDLNFAAMFITYIIALMLNIHGLGLVIGRQND